MFSCVFWDFSKNTSFTEHLRATASKYCKIKKEFRLKVIVQVTLVITIQGKQGLFDIPKYHHRRLLRPAADDDFMLKRTGGQVDKCLCYQVDV